MLGAEALPRPTLTIACVMVSPKEQIQRSRVRLLDETKFPVTSFEGFDDFMEAKELPVGYLTFTKEGLPIDMLNRSSGAETTIVIFHAAVTPKVETLPYFAGQTVTKGAAANRLWIQDPSLYMDDRLLLSWFAGNAQQTQLQADLVRVIQKVFDLHGSERMIFFGASGGGFASLFFSRFFPGSLAIAINPQTILKNYAKLALDQYAEHAFGVTGERRVNRVLTERVCSDLREHYVGFENHVAYLQNATDHTHVEPHLLPFMEALGVSEQFNLSIGRWGDGHRAPDKDYLNELITTVLRSRGNWAEGLGSLGFCNAPSREDVLSTVASCPPCP